MARENALYRLWLAAAVIWAFAVTLVEEPFSTERLPDAAERESEALGRYALTAILPPVAALLAVFALDQALGGRKPVPVPRPTPAPSAAPSRRAAPRPTR